MVVFMDLDQFNGGVPAHHHQSKHWAGCEVSEKAVDLGSRPNPNINAMTEALGCYPVVTSLATHLDLNTLDNLSRTCRQIHTNLLQFRSQLIPRTLRCTNEDVVPNKDHTLRYRARAADWYFVEPDGGHGRGEGKVGSCARDFVGECRRCARVVCRNCTVKPPAPILLAQRHRRLCRACIRAPLPTIVSPSLPAHLPITSPLVSSAICACPDGVFLCQPCGRGLRSADTTYDSIWRWRTRYGPTLGGFGTGFGEGNRSFECGRGSDCLAARWVEEEIDCDAEDARESNHARHLEGVDAQLSNGRRRDSGLSVSSSTTTANTLAALSSSPSSVASSTEPGYLRHEIEGIGGVVKKKLVRMVKVGSCVEEWDDERAAGRYLVREVEGLCRSWCGWCWRVVPGVKDKEPAKVVA